MGQRSQINTYTLQYIIIPRKAFTININDRDDHNEEII